MNYEDPSTVRIFTLPDLLPYYYLEKTGPAGSLLRFCVHVSCQQTLLISNIRRSRVSEQTEGVLLGKNAMQLVEHRSLPSMLPASVYEDVFKALVREGIA